MSIIAEHVRQIDESLVIIYRNFFQVIQSCITDLSRKVVQQSLPAYIISELRWLLIYSCHRIAKVREVASSFLDRLITSFPSFMCDENFVHVVLEVLTILKKSCEGEFTDEVSYIFLY